MGDGPTVVLPIPRLRLTRHAGAHDYPGATQSIAYRRDTQLDPAVSNPQDVQHDLSDEDQSTPKMRPAATLLDSAETPAARLRAVLSRIPASSKPTAVPHPIPSSDNDSDFDPPDGLGSANPSSAQKSLRDIFSHALRDPGHTRRRDKVQQRRNSIDISEVDASPRAQREREKHKRNRKSLSDEEIEHSSMVREVSSSHLPDTAVGPLSASELSIKASPASTFDLLRERLAASHTQIKDIHLSDSLYDRVCRSLTYHHSSL